MGISIDTNEVLDNNLLKVVGGVLRGQNVSPLNANEKYFIKYGGVLRRVDGELDGGLISFVNHYKKFISASNCLHLLLNAYRLGRLSEAVSVMPDIESEDLYLSKEACLTLLKSDIPMLWNVYLLSDDESFQKRNARAPEVGLDMDRLNNFK